MDIANADRTDRARLDREGRIRARQQHRERVQIKPRGHILRAKVGVSLLRFKFAKVEAARVTSREIRLEEVGEALVSLSHACLV